MRSVKSSTCFSLISVVIFLVAAVATVLVVNQHQRRQALVEAEAKTRIILDRNLATHRYINKDLKPHVFSLTDGIRTPEFFDPTWMSSTFAVRQIDAYFKEMNPEGGSYYYKECAINARSPLNEADPAEKDFLLRLNANPKLETESGVRTIGGQPYFVVMQRGEAMEPACMRCHSRPAAAPADLVTRYGDSRSFNRRVGEIVSAISIRVPLAAAYASANSFSLQLSFVLLMLLGLIFLLQHTLARRLFIKPLATVRDQALAVAGNEERLGEELPAPFGRELREVVEAFNSMSRELRGGRDELEHRVSLRTQQLSWANDELVRMNELLEGEVAQRRRAQEELERAMAAAEGANRMKSLFLATMSHEIRTPMSGIIGMTNLTLDTELSHEQRENLEVVRESAHSLLRLLNDILDLSKIEAGKLELEDAPFSVPEFVETALKPLRVQAEQRGIALVAAVTVPPELAVLVGDCRRLRQIIVNLVGNALKFTERGKVTVNVSVERAAEGAILTCGVTDTGIGIRPDELPMIFEMFTQADSSVSRRYGGTGLGLAISKELVSMMGGKISATSTFGDGSTFIFSVPLPRLPQEVTTTVDPSPEAAPLRPLRVLLAEDDDINARIADRMLSRRGHRVVRARNGCEAVAAAATEPFDIILMDIQMPEMDGMEAAARLRRGEAGPAAATVPIIAVTAHALAGDRERFIVAGMKDCLSKPYREVDLHDLITQYTVTCFDCG